MSSSSDCTAVRRTSRADHEPQDQPETPRQAEPASRRSSRYEIYGTATRPFGESYRRSLLLQPQDLEPEAPATTPDSVEEDDMGCSTSRSTAATEGVKGTFQPTATVKPSADHHGAATRSDVKVNGVVMKTINNNTINNYKGLSDFEIIYGSDNSNKNNIDEGYSTTDIYSEVRKPEKSEKKSNQIQQSRDQTPREKLMQQIRDRKGEDNEEKHNGYCSFATIEKEPGDDYVSDVKSEDVIEQNQINSERSENVGDENKTNNVAVIEPISFVEEEFSYEPDKKEATSKLVVRSRSLINLDQTQANNVCTLNRPNKLKITTKPDGTIRYGLSGGCSEPDLLDDSPPVESEVRNNYVSSIKSAFDAAIESHSLDRGGGGRAEAFDGLRQYFHDNKHGLRELLVNNNVVIIEPFRPDPPHSPSDKSDTSSQRTCRITGATIKSPNGEQKSFVPSNTLPRRHTKSNRPTKQGFYHPIKVNKELIDAELPDPDKVKNAKELFEKIFKSRSSGETPKKTPTRSFFNTITSKMRITPEVKVVQEGKTAEKKKQNRLLMEQVTSRRWTDSGSLSSGVSSDLSYDHDCDYYHQEGEREEYTSDDDLEYIYPYDDAETHPVSPEVLQKIRACGTSTTYYGGRIIARSHGPLRSPMTMTIMDEIRRHGGTHEGRKRFEEEPALGVKFRLVKSHSCGSRLEIAGTEEETPRVTMTSPHHKSIAEEVTDDQHQVQHQETSLEEEEDKAEADRYTTPETTSTSTPTTTAAPPVMTWAELKLKEARRLWHCAPEAVRAPPQDMEFETFEVLEDKQELAATGRG